MFLIKKKFIFKEMSIGNFFSASFLFLVVMLYQHLKSSLSAAATSFCYLAQASTLSMAINSTS